MPPQDHLHVETLYGLPVPQQFTDAALFLLPRRSGESKLAVRGSRSDGSCHLVHIGLLALS